jgi:hypothetical protein
MYTNNELNELVILGSGTMIRRSGDDHSKLASSCHVSAEAIIEKGQTAIESSDWVNLEVNRVKLSIVELQILTLGENAGVRFKTLIPAETSSSTTTPYTLISSKPSRVDGVEYCENVTEANWESLATYDTGTTSTGLYLGWSVMSRANLLTGPSIP